MVCRTMGDWRRSELGRKNSGTGQTLNMEVGREASWARGSGGIGLAEVRAGRLGQGCTDTGRGRPCLTCSSSGDGNREPVI